MSAWQLALDLEPDVADVVGSLLEARGAAVEAASPAGPSAPDEARGWLVATFDGEPDLLLLDAVGAWLGNLGAREAPVATRRGASGPWEDGWRAVLGPFRVSDRLWVAPPWGDAPEGARAIRLDPTGAFGGGAHPTTAAILAMLDRALRRRPEARVLDVGAGTGILAIGAALLGAEALGVEIDPAAVADAERNAARNGVTDRARFRCGTVEGADGTWDVVVANVYTSVLVAVADAIAARTGGVLLLSGIQDEREPEILNAYADFDVVERASVRGWTTLWLERRPAPTGS